MCALSLWKGFIMLHADFCTYRQKGGWTPALFLSCCTQGPRVPVLHRKLGIARPCAAPKRGRRELLEKGQGEEARQSQMHHI